MPKLFKYLILTIVLTVIVLTAASCDSCKKGNPNKYDAPVIQELI